MEPTSIQSGPPPQRARARELGVRIGIMPPGPTNSIVDVTGVAVGHRTVWRDEPAPPDGRGIARTGVTAIVPFGGHSLFRERVPAGIAILNGAGAAIGHSAIEEWGVLETPIFLTSSMAIGRVYDAAVAALMASELVAGGGDPCMPVVAECDDGFLNQAFPVQVESIDVLGAMTDAVGVAAGPVRSGVVGAGTGMRAFRLKGGIGSASRRVAPSHRWAEVAPPPGDDAYTVGALVLSNYGELDRLTIDGVRVGEALLAEGWPAAGIVGAVGIEGSVGAAGASVTPVGTAAAPGRTVGAAAGTAAAPVETAAAPVETAAAPVETAAAPVAPVDGRGADGSCIVVVATDAPLLSHQLRRLAVRAGLGLARTGSIAHHGSGEIFLAFSTGLRIPRGSDSPLHSVAYVDDEYLDPIFGAVVEATEEAAIDSMFTADTVVGRGGHCVPGLPAERTLELLRAAGRLVDDR